MTATYADPTDGLAFELQSQPMGFTYDPSAGADWWRCPLCARQRSDHKYDGFVGTYAGLRTHLGNEHNVRVTEQTLTITVGRTFDTQGQVVRYVDDRPSH